jgi:hypothetical protein
VSLPHSVPSCSSHLTQTHRKWKDRPDCPPELKIFAGKRVIGALAGRVIKPADKSISPKELAGLWKDMGYVVLLPSGEGLCWESSCHFTVT